jgi:hypothetical protein
MKKNFLNRSRLFSSVAAIAIAGTLILSSCDKDDDDDMNPPNAKYSISGTASGAQEVPAITTTATGTLSGSYDTTSKTLIYSVNWSGLSGDATAAHFHGPASTTETAPPLQDLMILTNGTSGTASDTITASAALHTALVAGKVYYNVHTAANPDGEIRGHVNLAQ